MSTSHQFLSPRLLSSAVRRRQRPPRRPPDGPAGRAGRGCGWRRRAMDTSGAAYGRRRRRRLPCKDSDKDSDKD